jgi:hemerythrin-like metal-binding protein
MFMTTGSGEGSAKDSASLRLSVRILDRDHLEMSETLKSLQADMFAGKDRGQTVPLLRKFSRFTLAHFALEEGMMAAGAFPGFAQHSVRHQAMTRQLRAFISSYNRGCSNLGANLPCFLYEWHGAHVRNEDLQLGRWLNGYDDLEPKECD